MPFYQTIKAIVRVGNKESRDYVTLACQRLTEGPHQISFEGIVQELSLPIIINGDILMVDVANAIDTKNRIQLFPCGDECYLGSVKESGVLSLSFGPTTSPEIIQICTDEAGMHHYIEYHNFEPASLGEPLLELMKMGDFSLVD